MSQPGPMERAREDASRIAALLVTGIWLPLMLAGFEYWLPLMLFGYIVVVPLVGILFDEEGRRVAGGRLGRADTRGRRRDRRGRRSHRRGGADDEALARLRESATPTANSPTNSSRRKVERLLETESLEDVEDRYAGSVGRGDRERDVDDDRDRLRESEVSDSAGLSPLVDPLGWSVRRRRRLRRPVRGRDGLGPSNTTTVRSMMVSR